MNRHEFAAKYGIEYQAVLQASYTIPHTEPYKRANDFDEADLAASLSAAAHLIHGSSDGRFSVTYCTELLSREEIEGVCYRWMPYREAAAKYRPEVLKDGFNIVDGEEIFYISNPALGLWTIE